MVALLAMLAPMSASAQVAVDSVVFLEQRADGAGDRPARVVAADRFISGDSVVTILRWDAPSRGRYTLTSAVPRGLVLRSASRDGLEYSTDGGRNWRLAQNARSLPSGITHLRWQAGPGEGRLSYRSVVL